MAKKSRTVSEQRYHNLVASLGCVVCRNLGYGKTPATIHHIRTGQGTGQRAEEYLVIPLCPQHHQLGGHGVAIHAGQKTFENLYGTELQLLNQTFADINAAYHIALERADL